MTSDISLEVSSSCLITLCSHVVLCYKKFWLTKKEAGHWPLLIALVESEKPILWELVPRTCFDKRLHSSKQRIKPIIFMLPVIPFSSFTFQAEIVVDISSIFLLLSSLLAIHPANPWVSPYFFNQLHPPPLPPFTTLSILPSFPFLFSMKEDRFTPFLFFPLLFLYLSFFSRRLFKKPTSPAHSVVPLLPSPLSLSPIILYRRTFQRRAIIAHLFFLLSSSLLPTPPQNPHSFAQESNLMTRFKQPFFLHPPLSFSILRCCLLAIFGTGLRGVCYHS